MKPSLRTPQGVFLEFWRSGLLAYDDRIGIEWEWLAMDGALGKAPLGGELTGPNPTDRAKKGRNGASSPRGRASRWVVRDVFGEAPVQRCVRHKERNVTNHLPERDRPSVQQRLRRAWALDDRARALDQLRQLARELDRSYPGAAGSLREGMEETLTLTRLGVTGSLKRTLESTNPCESMLEIVRRTQRNVKRWSSGEIALRWTAAGMLEAERQFRKIIGYRDLATLVVAIERDHDRRRHSAAARTPTKEAAIVLTA